MTEVTLGQSSSTVPKTCAIESGTSVRPLVYPSTAVADGSHGTQGIGPTGIGMFRGFGGGPGSRCAGVTCGWSVNWGEKVTEQVAPAAWSSPLQTWSAVVKVEQFTAGSSHRWLGMSS